MKLLLTLLTALLPAAASAAGLDVSKLDSWTGLKGTVDAKSGVYKVSYPRKDVDVKVGGVKVTPAMGLTAWAAFTGAPKHAMVMGDVVLLEGQVDSVMSAALDNGLSVTALHNHFLWDSPRVMFMHIEGMGDEQKLGQAVGAVFAKLREKADADDPGAPEGDIDPALGSLDTAKLDAALRTKGLVSDHVYKAVFGLETRMAGHQLGAPMGVSTWAAFAGSDDRAVVDGDFAVYEKQLQPVLRALRARKISVAAIHNHMTGEEPRVVFLHYWGMGKAADLAAAVRGALDAEKP